MTSRIRSRWSLALGSMTLALALAPAPQAADQAGPLKELALARVQVCERMLDYYREARIAPPKANPLEPQEAYAAGYEPIEVWSRHLLDARLDVAGTPEQRVLILAAELERIKKFSGDLDEIARGDRPWKVVADKVAFSRLEVEYRLAKEKFGK